MVQHALDRGYEVVAVCRDKSVGKLAEFEGRINIVPGATDDREVIKRAVAGCDGVLVGSSGGGCTVTRRERPRRSSTTRSPGRGWCSRAGGTSLVMARTSIRGGLRHWSTSPAVSDASRGSSTSTTRWRRPSASSPATPAGPSCAAATSRRATARACRVEPPRGRPRPREQHHAPRGLRSIDGGGPRRRRSRSRGPGDRQTRESFGAAACSCRSPQLSLIENALSLQRSTPGASVASRDRRYSHVHSAWW